MDSYTAWRLCGLQEETTPLPRGRPPAAPCPSVQPRGVTPLSTLLPHHHPHPHSHCGAPHARHFVGL